MKKVNIFDKPKKYLNELNRVDFFEKEVIERVKKEYDAYSLACVWTTKLCPLGCETCFFKSGMDHNSRELEEYQFSDKGLKKLIKFISDSNNGYLMLSGGGDPMICPSKIEQVIREVKSKRIIVITSGFWAKTEISAKRVIDKLYEAIKERKYKNCGHVVLRISVDEHHRKKIGGNDPYKNIINVFRNNYVNDEHFSLLFHSLKQDTVVEEIAKEMNASLTFVGSNKSDNEYVEKIMVESSMFTIGDFSFPVSYSKLFNSNVMIDLNNADIVANNKKVITEDIKSSEQNNPAYVLNLSGKKGLDYWINYNGNVTSWMNQDPDNIYNLYKDSYKKFVNKTLCNPMSLFLIKKGYSLRNDIISEVNPLAVKRAESVNIRDYYATLLLRERNTKLYYYIRAIQSFINDGLIKEEIIENLSIELKNAIIGSLDSLKALYVKSDYDILEQELNERKFDKEIWLDWFTLVKRGHYNVNKERLAKKIIYFNKMTDMAFSIDDEIVDISMYRYNRISESMSPLDRKLLSKIIKNRDNK